MALIGRPLLGSFQVFKSGHQLNNQLFRKLLADPLALQLVQPPAQAAAKGQSLAKGQRSPLLRASSA
jgi:UDP-3-O-acyl-N-acetylglucosamine deacetylase